MKVQAIARGYDNTRVREPGEVFEFKGKLGKWMREIKEGDEAKAADAQAEIPAPAKEHKAKKQKDKEVI